jgi:hypothetical protein
LLYLASQYHSFLPNEAKTEEESGVITMDVCGEPDELEASGSTEEEVIQRKVTIGSQNYTLVLKGTTLDISGEVHRRSPSPEETTIRFTGTVEDLSMDSSVQVSMVRDRFLRSLLLDRSR